MIVVSEGQYRYTLEQADVLAESKGYGSDNGAALMEDLDYFCCFNCADYVVEPGGWSEQYHGVLCNRCAHPINEAQRLHEEAGGTGMIWATIAESDRREEIIQKNTKAWKGQVEFWAEQHKGAWYLFKRPIETI